jgi:choline dehydrogenase-like flavoprotein
MRDKRRRREATLAAVADTYFPAVREREDPGGFWGRRGSQLGVQAHVLSLIETGLPPSLREGLLKLVDLLGATGFARLPLPARTRVALPVLARLSPDVSRGLDALRQLSLLFAYATTGEDGTNPNWAALGYPGPPNLPPPSPAASPLPLLTPEGPEALLEADVVVVGSGAGGGVIAGELARAGRDVVVLEAGGAYHEGSFPRDELSAFRALYWRGGSQPTEEGLVTLLAGATLGGGTTVNWTNCYPTPPHVRAQWAREFGLEGLEGPAFDRHLAAVLARLGASDRLSEDLGGNARLRAGAEALGLACRRTLRNADPLGYHGASAGHMGYGDRSGSKRGVVRTYLQDAVGAGARLLVRCRAEAVLVERGQAVGVRATFRPGGNGVGTPGGAPVQVTVRARHVVVACGALETPALLLRSGLGGPAVGRHLRLHPCVAVAGLYPERVEPWMGAPHTTQVTEYLQAREGHGFLVECAHFHPGLTAASLPWRSGRAHKALMAQLSHGATFLGRLRERGEGRVRVDAEGEAVVSYPLGEDPLDRQLLHDALEAVARVHRAAGARQVVDLSRGQPTWSAGDGEAAWEAFVAAMRAVPLLPGQRPYFSAHQMGSARMGRDGRACVADPTGQLHTTRGVWVGDTSAFPTATGANPMLTAMALARRTAEALLAVSPGRGLVEPRSEPAALEGAVPH